MSPPRARLAVAAVMLLPHLVVGEGRPGRADDFVELSSVAPGVRLDIRYATPHNFTKQALYPAARCRLRRAVAERLGRVQGALANEGFVGLATEWWHFDAPDWERFPIADD